jgi:carboxyl-terminal processing protease
MNKSLKVTAITVAVVALLVIAFAGGAVFDHAVLQPDAPTWGSGALKSTVGEVYEIIQREALSPSDDASMTAGAVNGMLMSLDDPYANYFDAKHFEYFNEEAAGEFHGIGVTITSRENDLVIVSVIEGTPAERAGLKADDVIVEIDGQTRPKWDSDEAVTLIRGEEGTTVTLGIRRGDSEEIKDYTITRAKIQVPNVDSELLEDDIGYVRLYSFNERAEEDLKKALEELEDEGAKGFILDLRDNPGGLLSESADVASLFVEDGVIVTVEDREGTVEEYRASGKTTTDAPLVVLVNGDSASASEIVAGAFQDHARAKLVGETTFGKGSVQQIEELSAGGAIKLTIAKYVLPKGRTIDKIGLTPDFEVPMEFELQADKDSDTQLKKAIEVLKDER